MRNGYNRIAYFYDELAWLVFGDSIRSSQKYLLNQIPGCSTILIMGGGTGWLLKEVREVNRYCRIYFIDASSKMIALAKVKAGNDKRVVFIHGTEDDIPTSLKFDGVITNFYLDLFSESTLQVVVRKIRSALEPGSFWLATDFVPGTKWWQRAMLRMMYRFFKMATHIEAERLPAWDKAICQKGFSEQAVGFFYQDFIRTSVFQCT